MRTHLDPFIIFLEQQAGFRLPHTCTTVLLKVTDDLYPSIHHQNKLCALVLIDCSKAFDKINHALLLAIVNFIGFSVNAQLLMTHQLHARSKYVALGSEVSVIPLIYAADTQINLDFEGEELDAACDEINEDLDNLPTNH
ncbi:hypothetical protein JTB14_029468 [Gonioctena quinquepunctata]|nr:hypothetical protein JTB14_029468 [Gonioctena quinquepunctata]